MFEWIKAINKNDIPQGTGAVVTINDQQIAFFCVEGKYYAINNICPHRGGPLGEGEMEGSVVTCPWHGWEFDVTTGQSPINPAACVTSFSVRLEGDDLYIQIESV